MILLSEVTTGQRFRVPDTDDTVYEAIEDARTATDPKAGPHVRCLVTHSDIEHTQEFHGPLDMQIELVS